MDRELVKVFESVQFGKVRTVVRDGEPWFVAKDVCDALQLKSGRTSIDLLDADEKGVHSMDTLGGCQNCTVISESGLYSLIIKSRKPEAKEFKRWITHDVIPSIRKHGMYANEVTIDKMIGDPDFAIRLLTELKGEREKARMLQTNVDEMKPKVDYLDRIINAPEAISVTLIAKDYGMSPHRFNELLHSKRVQYKCNGAWVLYKNYENAGYMKSETGVDRYGCVRVTNRWTQKGRQFLYDLLKRDGIVPNAD